MPYTKRKTINLYLQLSFLKKEEEFDVAFAQIFGNRSGWISCRLPMEVAYKMLILN